MRKENNYHVCSALTNIWHKRYQRTQSSEERVKRIVMIRYKITLHVLRVDLYINKPFSMIVVGLMHL